VRLLDVLSTADLPPSVRSLAEATGLSKSAVQRLLAELDALDLVAQDTTTRRYRLGPKTLALGMAYQHRVDVRQAALPHMRQLCESCQETVGVSVGLADQLLHVDQVEPQRTLHAKFHLGRPLPLWSGAPAKVLLSVRTDDEIHRVLDARTPTDLEPVNPPTAQELLDELDRVRERGYARAFEETLAGVNTISAPVAGAQGEVVGVLSITAPVARLTPERMEELLPALLRAAELTSADLGWRGGSPIRARSRV